MIKRFVMAGVILGAASSFAVGGSVTTYDQNGTPSYGPAASAPKPKGMSWFEIQHLVALHKCPPVEKFVLHHRDTSMSWFDIEQMMTIYDCVLAPKQATPKIIIGPDGETSMIMP
jgi:hypothetical protein